MKARSLLAGRSLLASGRGTTLQSGDHVHVGGGGLRMSLARPTWLPVLFLVLSCAASQESGILPELLAHEPVCLALDWGTGPPPSFFGWAAPDTLLLLPERGEDLGNADSAGAEGRVALAGSQQNRKGAGWIWWTQHDTVVVSSTSPTMDDLVVLAVRPEGRVVANWKGSGMAARERGQVALHPYECKGLPEPAP